MNYTKMFGFAFLMFGKKKIHVLNYTKNEFIKKKKKKKLYKKMSLMLFFVDDNIVFFFFW
jgi:hypothetical protein